jgi:hypothetical protein
MDEAPVRKIVISFPELRMIRRAIAVRPAKYRMGARSWKNVRHTETL